MANKKKKSGSTTSIKDKVSFPSIQDLFKAGFHFGHTTARWSPKMERYIYTQKDGIHIIDLTKTIKKLETFLENLNKIAEEGPVLIVGTKKQAADTVKEVALENGMFYIVNRYPGGTLTNFKVIRRAVKEMLSLEEQIAGGMFDFTKKEVIVAERELTRKMKLYEGIKFMKRKPKAIVVVDGHLERTVVSEANKLNIPIFGMVDTNDNPRNYDYFVPANDDAIKAINLFLNLVGETVKDTTAAKDLKARRARRDGKISRLEEKAQKEKEKRERERKLEAQRMRKIKKGTATRKTVEEVVKKDEETSQEAAAKSPEKPKKKKARAKIKKKTTGLDKLELTDYKIELLEEAGIKSAEDVVKVGKRGLLDVKGIGEKTAEDILEKAKELEK
jgi:small subunit ribosomal protein S2